MSSDKLNYGHLPRIPRVRSRVRTKARLGLI